MTKAEDYQAEVVNGGTSSGSKMTCCGDDVKPEEGSADEAKYGKKREFDKNFKGPIREGRGCTDIICCLLFVAVILGHIVVAFFAFSRGDPKILLAPTDYAGNICGRDKMVGKNNLIYFDIWQCARMGTLVFITGCPTPQVCVEKCPTEAFTYMQMLVPGRDNAASRKELMLPYCKYTADKYISTKSAKELVDTKLCPPYYLNSTGLVNRCIPTIFVDGVNLGATLVSKTGDAIQNADNTNMTYGLIKEGSKWLAKFMSAQQIAQNVFNDVIAGRWMILAGCVIGACLAFTWCLLVRCLAGCIIWCTLILFFVAFGFGAAYCFYRYQFVATKSFDINNIEFTTNLNYYLALRETWLVAGIAAGILMLIVLLILICLRSRIRLAIAVIGEASKAVAAIMTTLIFPLIPWVFELGCLGLWGSVSVYLAATGKAEYKNTNLTTLNSTGGASTSSCDQNLTLSLNTDQMLCQFAKYGGNEWAYYLQGYNLFVCLWMLAFTIGMGQLILAGAFSSWYWAWEKPKDVPAFPIASSLWRSLRYHIGTVAFGSFILAVIWLLRIILEYISHKTKDSQNVIAKIVICCCKCCLWCLEKCIKFLTKNAYIVTAIYGKAFCPAAKDAFFLILRNILRVATINCVTSFVLFVGKVLVTGATVTLAFFFFDGTLSRYITELKQFTPGLNYFFVPVIIIGVATWVVATIFFNVYDFAVDTLFICVMEDFERNDGTPEKPYFMSKDLMKVLDVKNKFEGGDPDKREGCFACCTCCCC